MAIIINEFEVVAPPDGAANGGNDKSPARAASAETTAASTLQPADVEEIMRRALLRRLRVWAD